MKIAVNVNRKLALKRGTETYGRIVVIVPIGEFSQPEIDWLAECGNSPDCDVDLSGAVHPLAESADVVGIRDVIDTEISDRFVEIFRRDQKNLENSALAVAALDSHATRTVTQNLYGKFDGYVVVEYQVPNLDSGNLPDERQAEYEKWREELDASRESAIAAGRDEVARREAEAKAKKHAYAEDRAAWIDAHGSARLRSCLAEKIECDAIYRDERLSAERPDWQWYQSVPGTYDDPRNPPAEAFEMLAEARGSAPEATLVFAGKNEDGDSQYAALSEFLGDEIVYGWPQ